MNFLNFDASSLASLGENLSRDIGAGFEQLKKGVEETLREQDDQVGPEDESDREGENWSFGAIDSLVKTLVGDGVDGVDGPGRSDSEGKREGEGEVEDTGPVLEDAGVGSRQGATTPSTASTADESVVTANEPAERPSKEASSIKETASEENGTDGRGPSPSGGSRRKARRKPNKLNKANQQSNQRPTSNLPVGQKDAENDVPDRQKDQPIEAEPETHVPAPPTGTKAHSPEPTRSPPPAESVPVEIAPKVENAPDVDALHERIRDLEEKAARQAKELVVLKKRVVKERDERQEVEARLKAKNAEVEEVMEEGEALSKKQLVMETTIKQLKAQLASTRGELTDRESALQAEKRRGDEEASSKAEKEAQLASLRSEHEETVKMLRAELVATERKLSSLSKDGSSDARKLQEAQNRASALQDSLEEVREEMRRQRVSADEREEMLQSEIASLQRRCSEAEARQKDSESKLPEATAPLLVQVESLQKKLEDQDRLSMAAQKRLVDRVEELEKTIEALRQDKRELAEQTEEATSRFESLYSQLSGAQQKASDAERVASEERLAKQNAEASLALAQAELTTIESTYSARIDELTATESLLKKTIRDLEEELIQERERRESLTSMKRGESKVADENGAGSGRASPKSPQSMETSSPMRLFAADSSENTIRRKIRELEETKERLSAALVKAEQRAASGDAANKQLAELRKKLDAASEVIGEKEEKIDELRADLADIKDILASQQDQLATALSAKS